MMTPYAVRVFFMDEAPSIGSGQRKVIVLEGRKWVRIACPYSGRRARLSVAQWQVITKHAKPADMPKRKRRRK